MCLSILNTLNYIQNMFHQHTHTSSNTIFKSMLTFTHQHFIGILLTSHNTFIFIYVFQRGLNFNLTFVFKHITKAFIYFELYTCINAC
jgi:hypothetical protein